MPESGKTTTAVIRAMEYSAHIWNMCEMEKYDELMLEFVGKNPHFVMTALLHISPRLTKMRRDDLMYAIASQYETLDEL